MSTHRTRRAAVVLMVAALITAGCAKEIDGTPVATPGQAGKGLGPADCSARPVGSSSRWTSPAAAR